MIPQSELRTHLRAFILETFLFSQDPHPLKDNLSLMGSGYMDSMGVLELLDFLSLEYQVEVSSLEMTPENLDSIDNLVRFVSAKLHSRASDKAPLEYSL